MNFKKKIFGQYISIQIEKKQGDNSLENFLLKQIRILNAQLAQLTSEKDIIPTIYTDYDFANKFYALSAQLDIIYRCLTGHDNKYGKMEKKRNDNNT